MKDILNNVKKKPPEYRRLHLAIVIDSDGNILNFNWNQKKSICAERNVINNTVLPPNSKMIVVQIRRKKNNKFTLGNSIPCKLCRNCILNSNLSSVTYSLKNGSFETCKSIDLPETDYSASK